MNEKPNLRFAIEYQEIRDGNTWDVPVQYRDLSYLRAAQKRVELSDLGYVNVRMVLEPWSID